MKNFINKKNIFWDFDGVIMDSMSIRNKGFEKVLKEFPIEQVELLMQFHLKNGGLSRYVKFRYFFEEIRGEKVSDEEIKDLAQKFSKVMRKELVAPHLLIQDSLQFVKDNFNKYSMHIVSGSDQEELCFLCEKMQINSYFISIQGSPTPKKQLVKDLIDSFNYDPDQCLLIGDSINDYEAAIENKIEFNGYNNNSLRSINSGYIESFSRYEID